MSGRVKRGKKGTINRLHLSWLRHSHYITQGPVETAFWVICQIILILWGPPNRAPSTHTTTSPSSYINRSGAQTKCHLKKNKLPNKKWWISKEQMRRVRIFWKVKRITTAKGYRISLEDDKMFWNWLW